MNKYILTFLILISSLLACKDETVQKENILKKYAVFGDTISDKNAISSRQMFQKYQALKEGDTIAVKFYSTINSVCKVKGCWMNLDLGNGEEVFVKFRDYAFFVPRNADGSEAIVSGKAYLSIETVDEQKHYAEDAGATREEIEKITTSKRKLSFMADGVLIKK